MVSFSKKIKIRNKYIGDNFPTYFIADIASNHDQNLNRAKKLIELDFVGEVRGIGLICGIEMVSNKSTKQMFEPFGSAGKIIAKICQENGLIVRAIGDVIALCPPLIISYEEIDELFDILEMSIKQSFEHL